MKKILLSTVVMLVIAASIFGGYYYYVTNDLQEIETQQGQMREENENMPEATDKDIPFKQRGGAWFDENGQIKENGIADAISQRDRYLAEHMPPDGFGDKGNAANIPGVPTNWVQRGPQNLGGRTEAIVLHPAFGSPYNDRERNSMWAGGSTGGVWKSFSGGNNWISTNSSLDNYNVSCITLDPANSKILYAGTGQSDGASLLGGGVFKSYDGGMSWKRLEKTYTNKWSAVNGITVVHNTQYPYDDEHAIVLAAVENYFPEQEGAEQGIMRSVNGGKDWTPVKTALTASSIAVDPNDSSRAVAATCTSIRCKAWYSSDYGLTWSESRLGDAATPNPSPTPGLFETGSRNDTIHFVFQKSAPGSGPSAVYAQYGAGRGTTTVMSKSTTGGAYFSKYGLAGIPDGITQGVHAFWVSPQLNDTDPDSTVFIGGGTNLFRGTNGLFEQYPIGGTVVPLHNPPYPHVDFQTVVTDPSGGTNKKVFVATDGGVFHAEDITAVTGAEPGPISGWSVRNNKLQNTQYFAVAGDASSGTTIIVGGTQDNGTLRQIEANTNTVAIITGDGGASDVDGTYCFGRTTGAQYFRVNNCITAQQSPPDHYEVTNSCYVPDFENGDEFMIDTDSRNNNASHSRAFLGAQSVWRSDNVKTPGSYPPNGDVPVWYRIKDNSAYAGSTPEQRQIVAMASAPSNSNYMWVAENIGRYPNITVRGDLYRTTNALNGNPIPTPTVAGTPTCPITIPVLSGTPNWEKVDDHVIGTSSQLPSREITKILVDQSSAPEPDEIVYVGFGGFKANNLWRTTNHGQSWQNISGRSPGDCDPDHSLNGRLPCAPVRAIARHPEFESIIFVGTEIGIYVTPNVNASPIEWEPVMYGPKNVSVDDLNFIKVPTPQIPTTLLAGTYGRGVWSLKFPTPGVPPTPGPTRNPINDFDGDGRSDIAVVREDSAHKLWHVQGSTEAYRSQEFGNRDDQAAPADYDGDGKTDIAVYRGNEQKFYCLRSSDNTLATTQLNHQASQAEAALAADFDGDDLADKAVFDPYTGNWKVEQSSNGHLDFHWGEVGDTAVALDFNTDGQADFGVYHEANGMITLSYTANGEEFQKQFGLEGDVPVPGEYDGDKAMDLAVWRPDDDGEGNGCWYISYGANNYEGYDAIPWGQSGDIPVPGDYDGDGKLDIAVFRPSDGMWHMLQSSNGYYSELFGADGDKPVGIKATYALRGAGNHTFKRAPAWAEPKRRTPVRGVKQDTSANQAD